MKKVIISIIGLCVFGTPISSMAIYTPGLEMLERAQQSAQQNRQAADAAATGPVATGGTTNTNSSEKKKVEQQPKVPTPGAKSGGSQMIGQTDYAIYQSQDLLKIPPKRYKSSRRVMEEQYDSRLTEEQKAARNSIQQQIKSAPVTTEDFVNKIEEEKTEKAKPQKVVLEDKDLVCNCPQDSNASECRQDTTGQCTIIKTCINQGKDYNLVNNKCVEIEISGVNKCVESRKNMSAEARACCYVAESVAVFKQLTQKCACVDNNKVFDVNSKSCIDVNLSCECPEGLNAELCSKDENGNCTIIEKCSDGTDLVENKCESQEEESAPIAEPKIAFDSSTPIVWYSNVLESAVNSFGADDNVKSLMYYCFEKNEGSDYKMSADTIASCYVQATGAGATKGQLTSFLTTLVNQQASQSN